MADRFESPGEALQFGGKFRLGTNPCQRNSGSVSLRPIPGDDFPAIIPQRGEAGPPGKFTGHQQSDLLAKKQRQPPQRFGQAAAYYKSTPIFALSILKPLQFGSNSMICDISKTNRQEILKQASTHLLRCMLRRDGCAKLKGVLRTNFHPSPDGVQKNAALRHENASNDGLPRMVALAP